MNFDQDYLIVENSPNAGNSSLVEVKCGKRLITILGTLIGFTCAVMVLLKDRKVVTTNGTVLILFLSLFIVFSVLFVILTVLLLLAALDADTDLMSNYIWQLMVYLCVQLVLAVAVPIIVVIDDRPLTPMVLTWLVIVLIAGLAWTHFVAVVESYRMNLISTLTF